MKEITLTSENKSEVLNFISGIFEKYENNLMFFRTVVMLCEPILLKYGKITEGEVYNSIRKVQKEWKKQTNLQGRIHELLTTK